MSAVQLVKRQNLSCEAIDVLRFDVERLLFFWVDGHMTRIRRALRNGSLSPAAARREWGWRLKCYHCSKRGIGKLISVEV